MSPVGVSGSSADGSTGGTSGSAAGQTSSAQTGGAASSNANPAPTSSGRFSNLTNYLKANSTYNEANGGLAGQIGQGLNNQYNNVNNSLNQSQNEFTNSANQNHVQWDPTAQSSVNTALSDPYAYAYNSDGTVNQNNVNQFNNYRDASYQGPTSLSTGQGLQSQAQNYQNLANQTASESGRFAVLKDMFGTPQYSSGQQSLDNLFLQGNPGQMNALAQNRAQGNQLVNNINQTMNQDQSLGQQYTQDANQVAANTRAAIGQSINNFGGTATDANGNPLSYVDQKVASDKAKATSDYNTLQSAVNQGYITQADADALNLNMGATAYGVSPAAYLQQLNPTITRQNAISTDDQNKINALNQLAGQTQSGDNQNILNEFNGNTQAGSYLPTIQNEVGLNNDAYQSAIGSAQAAYQAKVDAANAAINGDQGQVNNMQNIINSWNAANNPTQTASVSGGANANTALMESNLQTLMQQNGFNSSSPEIQALQAQIDASKQASPTLAGYQGQLGGYQNQLSTDQASLAALQKMLNGNGLNLIDDYNNIPATNNPTGGLRKNF